MRSRRSLLNFVCVILSDIDAIVYAMAIIEDVDMDKPQAYKDLVASKETTNQLMETDEKIKFLEKNETLYLVPLLKVAKTIGVKMVL